MTEQQEPQDRLQSAGGRCFLAGTRWVARFHGQQAVGDTEQEAAENLIEKLPAGFDNVEL